MLNYYANRFLALLFPLILLSGCGGGGSSNSFQAPPSSGGLQLSIKGLPAGSAASVVLTGPGSFRQTFTASQTQTDLAEGVYTLTAGDAGANRATPATQTVAIANGKLAIAYVIYAPAIANVRDSAYGAQGDGKADDTLAIQKAVDDMSNVGGIVFIPRGVYLIKADRVPPGLEWSSAAGIYLKSNLTLSLESGASLEAMPTASMTYAILYAEYKSNINILGGTLVGDRIARGGRPAHLGSGGEYGHGLDLHVGNVNVLVCGVTSQDCWGDGFFIGWTDPAKNITFDNVTADHNRRQGLSIINADGVIVRNSTFKNTGGTSPEAGIDMEPEAPTHEVKNVLISNCLFDSNAGSGLSIPDNKGCENASAASNITIDGSTFISNGKTTLASNGRCGIDVFKGTNVRLTNNFIQNSMSSGINIGPEVSGSLISGNTVSDSALHGVMLGSCQDTTVTQNLISGSTRDGIYNYMTKGVAITWNTLKDNQYYGIQSRDCTGGEIHDNTFFHNELGDLGD